MKNIQYNQIVIMMSLTMGVVSVAHAQSVRNTSPLQIDEHTQEQQRRYDAMQSRLDKLSDLKISVNPWDVYNLAKAQAWLDFAFDSRAQRAASNVVGEAFNQSDKLTQQLEARAQNISRDTPIVPTSIKLRDDIWKIAEDMKRHANFNCAAAKVAQFEVQLVQAGHANQQLGWRHAKPYIQATERLSKDAQMLLDKGCVKTAVVPPVVMAKVEPTAEPVPTTAPVIQPTPAPIIILTPPVMASTQTPTPQIVREVRVISDRVHFAYKSANISPLTATLLDQIAIILRDHVELQLTLQGHTDKRGSQAYNLKLAKQRALNAKQYLVDAGIDAQSMKIVAYGKAKPAAPPKGRKGQAFNRRVEFMLLKNQLPVVEQYRDLQPKLNLHPKKSTKK